jgi:hypothetical protein
VEAEKPMFVIVQDPAADQAKVGNVVFPLARIAAPAILAAAELERNRADVIRVSRELPKTVVTTAKNGAEHAIARRVLPVMNKAHAKALAVRA